MWCEGGDAACYVTLKTCVMLYSSVFDCVWMIRVKGFISKFIDTVLRGLVREESQGGKRYNTCYYYLFLLLYVLFSY